MALGGWLVLLGLAAWGLLIDTSVTTNALANLLRGRLGSEMEVQVRAVGFAPLKRELVLHGVTLEAQDGRLEIERLRLFIDWNSGRGLGIDGIVAEAGAMWLTRPFLEALSLIDDGAGRPMGLNDTPPMQVDGLDLHVRAETGGWTDLGVLDMGAQRQAGEWIVQGKLEGTPTTRTPLWFHSTLDDLGAIRARTACDAVLLELLAEQAWLPQELRQQVKLWQPAGSIGVQMNLTRAEYGEPLDLQGTLNLQAGKAILPANDLGLPDPDINVDPNLTLRAALVADLQLTDDGDILSWGLQTQLEFDLHGLQAEVAARAGTAAPAGQDLELWLHVPRVDWEDQILPHLGRSQTVSDLEGMLQPSGGGQVLAWLAVPTGAWTAERPQTLIPRQIVIKPHEETSAAYYGDPNREQDGQRNLGFPARVSDITGLVLHGFTPDRHMADELALVSLRGQHPTGPARVAGMFRTRARWLDKLSLDQDVTSEMLISIAGDHFTVEEELFAALEGLSGVKTVGQIRPEFDPHGGAIDFELVLQKVLAYQALSTDLQLDFNNTSFRWAAGNMPLMNASGTVSVQATPLNLKEQASVVRLNLQGSSEPFATQTNLEGHASFGPLLGRASWLRLNLDGIDLSAPNIAALVSDTDARLSTGFEEHLGGAACTAAIQLWRQREDLPFTLEALLKTPSDGLTVQVLGGQIAPLQLSGQAALVGQLQNDDDPLETTNLKLALRASSPDHAAPLLSLACEPEPLSDWQVDIRAAGIDIEDPELAKLIASLIPEGSKINGFADGHILFRPGQPISSTALWLDCPLITIPAFPEPVGPVRGRMVLTPEGLITSPQLEISVAGITAVLTGLKLDPNTTEVHAITNIQARDVPLHERQLNLLLGEETAAALIEELNAQGLLSIESGVLELIITEGKAPMVRFDGSVTLRDASMAIGLPIEVQRMGQSEVTLISEEGGIRVRVKVVDLNASLAGRNLEGASFQATFIEPRLVIEDFHAGFEGGQLATEGLKQGGTASFFSMDLADPFPFSLSAALQTVDVGQLTRGMFQSEFANEGQLNGNLRLSGELGDLLGVRGTGRIEFSDSSLWAIPVFQALFATLGFDSTATFSNMETWINLEDGVISMSGMRLKSDLLSLVGEGTLDIEGDLNYSMEVRYSLVDKFGILNKIIYLLQDELIRISIEGDMSRPIVLARGFLSRFTSHQRQGRRLPIPPLSTLPRVW